MVYLSKICFVKKFVGLLLVCLGLLQGLFAQDCKVKLKALVGSYEGDCEKNWASGKGTAKGTDSYTGDFRSGLPHGFGKYQWANGDWYEGDWEKGQRSGQGTMHYADKEQADSLYGYWRKDQYIGRYKEPFIVQSRTPSVRDIDIEQDKSSSLKEIVIYVESVTGGARSIGGSSIEKPKINSIEILKGLYVQLFEQDLNVKRTVTTLRMVQFPFRARYIIGGDVIDIEILQEGRWEVEIKLLR